MPAPAPTAAAVVAMSNFNLVLLAGVVAPTTLCIPVSCALALWGSSQREMASESKDHMDIEGEEGLDEGHPLHHKLTLAIALADTDGPAGVAALEELIASGERKGGGCCVGRVADEPQAFERPPPPLLPHPPPSPAIAHRHRLWGVPCLPL